METEHILGNIYQRPREYAREAKLINRLVFGEHSSGLRNIANQEQLLLMNKLQKYNAHLIDMGRSYSLREKECENFCKFYRFIA